MNVINRDSIRPILTVIHFLEPSSARVRGRAFPEAQEFEGFL